MTTRMIRCRSASDRLIEYCSSSTSLYGSLPRSPARITARRSGSLRLCWVSASSCATPHSITVRRRSMDEIMEGLHLVRRSPRGVGTLTLAVRRPAVDVREVLSVAELDRDAGLIGDSWSQRPSSRTTDRSPHPDMQLNVTN